MKILYNDINVGATSPFKILHISDTHLVYGDERDGERKVKLAAGRAKLFTKTEEVLSQASELAKENDAVIMHTGDLIDFVSVANLERVEEFLDENDCFVCAGNHEFSLYVGEAWEDAEYRNKSLSTVQKSFKNDIRMSSRVINGVNFVALDDGYYLFEAEQLDFLKGEVAKGLPIVLLIHNPIYEEVLYGILSPTPGGVGYLTGVPDDITCLYTDKHRYKQQKADAITHETCNYIKNEPLIKAVLTGHLHCTYDGFLKEGVPQLITNCTDIRVITIS